MYTEPIADNERSARCAELTEADPRELWASDLLEAGLLALMEAEQGQSVSAALLAAELMDAAWSALGASPPREAELAQLTALDAYRPSRAPRRA